MMSLDARKSKRFRLHSIAVELHGPGSDRLARDFDFYTDRSGEPEPESCSVTLELLPRSPLPEELPALRAERVFPDCVLYRDGRRLIYEYSGALLEMSREEGSSRARLISGNEALAQELGYLYLQSEIGRFLDRMGLHRLHALGLVLPGGAGALVLLPSGGGKSTLAAELVQSGRCQLLSDDTPLVDRLGYLHPYPLRLSFRPDFPLPDRWRNHSSLFERRRHGEKILVPCSALPSGSLPRPGDRFRPAFVVIGRRHGRREQPELRPLPRWKGALPLLRDLVVGLGVPQVAELLLTRGLRSLPGLVPAGASRMAAGSALLARSRLFELELSRDPVRNARFLIDELAAAESGA